MWGNPVRVFGVIPTDASGEQVTIHIRPYKGEETTTTVTTEDGMYEFRHTPKVRTEYSATWGNKQGAIGWCRGVRCGHGAPCDTRCGSTVRVVTLNPAQGLQPCQHPKCFATLSMTHSY